MRIERILEAIGLKFWLEHNRPVLRYYVLEVIMIIIVLAAIITLLFIF